jgi:hypothetical protein
MTSTARSSFEQSMAAAADLQLVQQWRAAETVRAHLAPSEGRDDVLECLGIADVERPVGV